MFRRLLSVFLCLALLACAAPSAYANELPTLSAHSCVLMNEDGRVLYGLREDEALPMASTTKLMSALVAVENLPVEETNFETLRSLRLKDRDGQPGRRDLILPSLREYVQICKRYGKFSVLELKKTMEPSRYVGRAKEQVEEFLTEVIRPILDENRDDLGVKAEINV